MFKRFLAMLTLTSVSLAVGSLGGAPATSASAKTVSRDDTTYRGTGSQVVRFPVVTKPGLLKFRHDGRSNFIVHTINPTGKREGLLVNTVGSYEGTVLYNSSYGLSGIAALEIKADGPWKAVFKPISKARCWCATTIRGEGDQVLRLTPTRGLGTVRATHGGDSNFIAFGHPRAGSYGDLLFNEIGSYKGKATLPTGTRLVTVKADGPWSLTRG